MKYLFVSSMLAVMPAILVAQEGCPVGADLDNDGIVFVSEDGFEHHNRAPNGVITILSNEDDDGIVSKTLISHGVHVLQLSDLENGTAMPGSTWRFGFPMPVTELPAPTPGGGWTVTSTSMIGLETEVEVITHTWGAVQRYDIGSCRYDAILVRASYDGETYDHVEDSVYFPDLGTALLIRYSDEDATDTYTYRDIQTP